MACRVHSLVGTTARCSRSAGTSSNRQVNPFDDSRVQAGEAAAGTMNPERGSRHGVRHGSLESRAHARKSGNRNASPDVLQIDGGCTRDRPERRQTKSTTATALRVGLQQFRDGPITAASSGAARGSCQYPARLLARVPDSDAATLRRAPAKPRAPHPPSMSPALRGVRRFSSTSADSQPSPGSGRESSPRSRSQRQGVGRKASRGPASHRATRPKRPDTRTGSTRQTIGKNESTGRAPRTPVRGLRSRLRSGPSRGRSIGRATKRTTRHAGDTGRNARGPDL